MNNFQRICIKSCKEIFKKKNLNFGGFFEAVGEKSKHYDVGRYYVSKLDLGGKTYEIYLYEDSAELVIDNNYWIREAPDFDTSDEIITAFCNLLEEKLPEVGKQDSYTNKG